MLAKPWSTAAAAIIIAGLVAGLAGTARADDIEDRIQQMEDQIRTLKGELQDMQEQAAAHPPAPAAPQDDKTFKVYWKDGLRAETANKKFTTKIGGRIQNDWSTGTQDSDITAAIGDFKNGVEFRRARLYIEGTIYDDIIYKAQYDFAGGDADFKDVYLGMQNIPYVGTVKIGQFKEPFSLEELTSSNYITFLERSLPNALVPGRATGFQVQNAFFDERLNAAVGYFRASDSFGDNSFDSEAGVSGRLTGLPWYEDDGRRLLHLGVASHWRQPGEGTKDFDSRPENHLADKFIDTGDIPMNSYSQVGAETALVMGPASLQSEYIHTFADTPGSSNPDFWGVYVSGSYFLTGEHRPYKRESAAFDKVKPKRNFTLSRGKNSGWGAWELAARYSQLDLSDSGVVGGTLRDVTTGVNWYLNPNVRVMLNWVHADLQSTGTADLFATRFQVFF
jgi:phosphate-selective porin OprO/OprP